MTPATFWTQPAEEVLAALGSRPEGLDPAEAARRRLALPPARRPGLPVWRGLAGQFLNPLVLMLMVAAGISAASGGTQDAIIIVVIVLCSGGVGFGQEWSANRAVARLAALIHTRAEVRRGGVLVPVPGDEVVPGDVVRLSVGVTVPGDARVLVAEGLQVDEAALTGEAFPVEKGAAACAADVPESGRSAALFQGTHVISGTAEAVVVAVGASSELGRIGRHLELPRPPTDFERGLHRFGDMLAVVSVLLVLVIFAFNVLFHRPVVESLLFSVALAVGLVPELLPAIVSVNLARGARRMAEREVIVKRLSSIEDFGAVDVLCSDKTGTLTQGRIALQAALGVDGQPSARTLELAGLNASFESGYDNPIDAALRAAFHGDASAWTRIGEVPYDFVRKRLSVVLEGGGRRLLVSKGQVLGMLDCCSRAETSGGEVPIAQVAEEVRALLARQGEQGLRCLAVAVRELRPGPEGERPSRELEAGMCLVGLLTFADPVKPDAAEVLRDLDGLGVSLRILTGDDRRVARHVWQQLRGREPVLLTGAELREIPTPALERRVSGIDVFAEVDPAQKERIVAALRRAGRVVAYLGDGINDAPALRAADVGVSVDEAADVAREAADIVLRRRDLSVMAAGIREGRRTMVNTIKYVHYTTSANFGNMVSMAVASLFLPFLPLLPKQILLNNFLSDLPALTVAGDAVDPEAVAQPRRWNNPEIRRFMFLFGAISSVFDITMFGSLLALTSGQAEPFRTGWFVGSLLTEVLVLLVLRTRRSFLRSLPSSWMIAVTAGVALVAVAIPFVPPVAGRFGMGPLPAQVLLLIVAISVAYVLVTEGAKRWFFSRPSALAR